MKVRALEKMYYDKRDRMPGDVYDMDDRESSAINLLVAIKKIEIVADEPAPASAAAAPTYTTKVMQPEQPVAQDKTQSEMPPGPMTTDNTEGLTGGPRRIYRRRDMRSER